VGVAVTLEEHATTAAQLPLPGALKAFLFAALYVAAVGNGSYEPGLASLGGDQFRAPADRATLFNWFFVSCNVGQLVALTLITYVENSGRWALGFWIAAGVVALSIVIFFAGAPHCRQFRPGGNPLVRIAQVLFCAARNASAPRVSPALYYEADGGGDDASLRKLPRSPHFRLVPWIIIIPDLASGV
jgi:MFS family permease